MRKWRSRFLATGLDGLRDCPRSGRPSHFGGVVRSALFSLACRPVPKELFRNRWTAGELSRELLTANLVANIR